MMREMFLHEIRKSVEEIRSEQWYQKDREVTSHMAPAEKIRSAYGEIDLYAPEELLIDTVMKLIDLSYLARRKGLLELEQAMGDIPDTYGYDSLKCLVMKIINGTDPELIEEMAWLKHFASNMKDYSALQHLLMMMGTLDIQTGVHPSITEEKLFLALPEKLSVIARNYRDKNRETDSDDAGDGDTGRQWVSQDEIQDMLGRKV